MFQTQNGRSLSWQTCIVLLFGEVQNTASVRRTVQIVSCILRWGGREKPSNRCVMKQGSSHVAKARWLERAMPWRLAVWLTRAHVTDVHVHPARDGRPYQGTSK